MRRQYCYLLLLLGLPVRAGEWFPVRTIVDGKTTEYIPLPHAAKPWRICALLPHARDKYFWGVSWGLEEEALRLGVSIGIYQAGGYEHLAEQRQQFAECLALGADAIVLCAISSAGLNSDIERAAQRHVPVIDLVNGVSSNAVAARSLVSFADMSFAAARYMLADAGNRHIKVLWLPGPQDAKWVRDAEVGLKQALQGHDVDVVQGGYAATESSSQMALIRHRLKPNEIDYVLGNAVSAEMASNYLRYQAQGGQHARIIAFYATEPVTALIHEGRVLAAPSDSAVLQARIAVDLAIRVLEGKPHGRQVAPYIEVLDHDNIDRYDMSKLLAPLNQGFVQHALKGEQNATQGQLPSLTR